MKYEIKQGALNYEFPTALTDIDSNHRRVIEKLIQFQFCEREYALRWALEIIGMPDREKLVGVMRTAGNYQKELLLLSASKEVLDQPWLHTLQEVRDWACEKEHQKQAAAVSHYFMLLITILDLA